jgi:predicted nucleic acid-binding protein
LIVVDTNVIAHFLLPGERSKAMDRLHKRDPDWVAPRLWLDESLNVLCTYERGGTLTHSESEELLTDALALMDQSSYEIDPERVLDTARRTGCSGYDSQYISLAEDLGVKLYMCDRLILRKCPKLAIEPK